MRENIVEMSLSSVNLSLSPKEEAILLLGKLTELQLMEISSGLDLTVKEGKTDRKKALYNGIVRFLASEEVEDSEDEGLAIFEKLVEDMRLLLQEEELEKAMDDKFASLKATFVGDGDVGGGQSSTMEERLAEEREKLGLKKLMAIHEELRAGDDRNKAMLFCRSCWKRRKHERGQRETHK